MGGSEETKPSVLIPLQESHKSVLEIKCVIPLIRKPECEAGGFYGFSEKGFLIQGRVGKNPPSFLLEILRGHW